MTIRRSDPAGRARERGWRHSRRSLPKPGHPPDAALPAPWGGCRSWARAHRTRPRSGWMREIPARSATREAVQLRWVRAARSRRPSRTSSWRSRMKWVVTRAEMKIILRKMRLGVHFDEQSNRIMSWVESVISCGRAKPASVRTCAGRHPCGEARSHGPSRGLPALPTPWTSPMGAACSQALVQDRPSLQGRSLKKHDDGGSDPPRHRLGGYRSVLFPCLANPVSSTHSSHARPRQ